MLLDVFQNHLTLLLGIEPNLQHLPGRLTKLAVVCRARRLAATVADFVWPRQHEVLAINSGGAGFGHAAECDPALLRRDVALSYVSAMVAKRDYGLTDAGIAAILDA